MSTFITVKLRKCRLPSGGPVFPSLAVSDVDIPPGPIGRHIVVSIACDSSISRVYVKAIASSCVRDHRAVFTISEVVDPGGWSIRSSYDVLHVVFREFSVLQINHRKDRPPHGSINSYRIRCEIFSVNLSESPAFLYVFIRNKLWFLLETRISTKFLLKD